MADPLYAMEKTSVVCWSINIVDLIAKHRYGFKLIPRGMDDGSGQRVTPVEIYVRCLKCGQRKWASLDSVQQQVEGMRRQRVAERTRGQEKDNKNVLSILQCITICDQ